jgi:hypothetical protein
MGNVNVKFLQTSAGSYGLAKEGDTAVVSEAVAKQLEEKGVVKVQGSTSKEETVPEAGSVTISEQKAAGQKAEGDAKDATGKAAAKKRTSKR